MQEERKNIIRFSLDYNIIDIHTYPGYKGDLVVRITVKEKEAMFAIRKYALSIGIKGVVIKENKDVVQYEIYCITEDEGAYHIKTEDVLNETRAKHLVKDPWMHQGKK